MMTATLGSVITESSRMSQPGSSVSTVRPRVASGRDTPPATATVRPSIFASSSVVSPATRSITPACSAALADRLAASRTAFSAQSALRPRSSARLRMKATASLVIFVVMASCGSAGAVPLPARRSSPALSPSLRSGWVGKPGMGAPISTGVAAPRLVPGAIAATCVA